MKAISIIFIATFLAALVSLAGAADSSRPVVVVFPSTHGEGVDKTLADSSTKALCNYLREARHADVLPFDRESPTVLRAIMEKALTSDQVASYASHQQRIEVARALSYEYASSSEVSLNNGIVQVKVWLAKSTGGKIEQWEAIGQSSVGGSGDLNLDNAMQSATSAAVISVSRQGFLGLPSLEEKPPPAPTDTTAIGAELITPPVPPTSADYVGKAEDSLKSGEVAVAIGQFQQAVSADPSNPSLRIKLANAYVLKGLYDEASSQLDQAAKMNADEEQLTAARKNLDNAREGKAAPEVPKKPEETHVQPHKAEVPSTPEGASKQEPKLKADVKSAVAKISQGDSFWRASKVDEAAEAYREAIKINPADWRAYERLALVNMSMSLYAEARKAVEQLKAVQPNPTATIIANRYDIFAKVFDRSFAGLLKQYDRDAEDYRTQRITRESYYTSTKGLGYRVETMAKFLDALTVPDSKKAVNLHLSLACGLMSQATSSLQDYLETNNESSKSNADTFISQARKELDTVHQLDPKPVTPPRPPTVEEEKPQEPADVDDDKSQPQPDETTDAAVTPSENNESNEAEEQQPAGEPGTEPAYPQYEPDGPDYIQPPPGPPEPYPGPMPPIEFYPVW